MLNNDNLILNADGSVYHLALLPDEVGEVFILVGDRDRVPLVSRYFDRIDTQKAKREFLTHTGELNGKRISVVGTGIGTDNMDIVLNEIDTLLNIDLQTKTIKKDLKSVDFIRIGTSGSIQSDVAVGDFVLSTYGVGFDNLMHFYDTDGNGDALVMADDLADYLERKSEDLILGPYVFEANKALLEKLGAVEKFKKGITVSCAGFYAPQGRELRGRAVEPNLVKILSEFQYKKQRLMNFEMETSALYGLSKTLGHRAVSTNVILANRITHEYAPQPQELIEKLIQQVLTTL